MILSQVVLLCIAAAAPVHASFRCGTSKNYKDLLAARDDKDTLEGTGTDTSQLPSISIDLYIHAVANSSTSPAYLAV